MASDPRKSFSVGFTVFIATLVLIVALFTVGGPGVLEPTTNHHIVVGSANNVRKGSKVYLDGVVVGQVTSVDFQPVEAGSLESRNVRIRIAIARQNAQRIREGTFAWLGSEGLLGDQVVELKTGDWARPPLPPGSEVPFVARSVVEGLIGEETRASAQGLLDELLRLLREARSEEGSLGLLIHDDALYKNIARVAAESERALAASADLLEEVGSGRATLSELFFGREEAEALAEGIAALADLLRRIEADDSLVGALGPEFADSARSIASILDKIDRGEGTLGRLVNDPSIADNLSNVFLGVREEPLVRNLIRNAEVSGRRIFAEATGREEAEARLRAAIAEQARDSGAPVPAAGTDGAPAPALDLPSGGGAPPGATPETPGGGAAAGGGAER